MPPPPHTKPENVLKVRLRALRAAVQAAELDMVDR